MLLSTYINATKCPESFFLLNTRTKMILYRLPYVQGKLIVPGPLQASMSQPKLKCIDLFCGAGGCSVGYARAGFEVCGVDLHPQPDYPFPFTQADALTVDLSEYDLVVASPPCHFYSNSWARSKHKDKEYPDLIVPTRNYINSFNKPYIMENVEGAKTHMIDPVKLCGTMFDLQVFRHRMFEAGGGLPPLTAPGRCNHKGKKCVSPYFKEGGNMYTVCGSGGGWGSFAEWKCAMGIDWMTKKRPLTQAIPPAYTEHLGKQAMKYLQSL